MTNSKMTGLLKSNGVLAITATVTIDGIDHDITIPLTDWQQIYLRNRLSPEPEPPHFQAARFRDHDEFVRLRPVAPQQGGSE